MKRNVNAVANILSILLLAFIIFKQTPIIMSNFRHEGVELSQKLYLDFRSGNHVQFSTESDSIAIFWASWCGPCKIEMDRIQASIDSGKIDKDKVFAINAFEDEIIIRKFLDTNSYSFKFIKAPSVARRLNIQSTPTTIFLEKDKITRASSGISLLGIWLAESHLK